MRNVMLTVALLAVVGFVAGRDDDKTGKAGKTGAGDAEFVMKASASDLAEINSSTLAKKMAADASVKKFADKMIEDHTKTSKELLSLADKLRLRPAATMDAEHKAMATKLMSMKGAEFDKAYMAGQVKDHEAAVALFEKQSTDGTNEELKGWAKKTLPHLQMHLKMAKEIHGKLGGKGGDKAGGDKDH